MSENMIPAEVSLCTVTFGPPVSFAGRGGKVAVTLTSTHTVIHAATGVQLRSGDDLLETTIDGDNLTFQVPHVDQDGFIDTSGATVTHWAYTLTGEVKFGKKKIAVNRSFQVFVGQVEVDLDLIPTGPVTPGVTAPAAEVLSVAGRTGHVSGAVMVEALEPDLSASYVAFVTGTVGDGVANDAAAIQAGINAVFAAGGGELVGDTRKTYAVASQLTQPSGVTLRDFAFKRIANVFDVLVNSDPVAGNTNLGLINVTVDGDRATGALTKTNAAHRFSGIRWRKVTGSTIDDVLVRGTVNGEIQTEGNRAAIALEDCVGVTVDSRTEDNDGTGLMLFGTTHDCDVTRHKSVADLGSGFSSQSTTYDNRLGIIKAVDNGIGGAAGTYSAISVNGPGYTADHLESLRANAGGINIGHETQAADGFRAMFVKATNSGLSDLIVRGSKDIEIAVAQLKGGGTGAAGHGNARIYPECDRVKIGRLTGRDAVAAGVLIEGGVGHDITFDVSGAGGHGVQSNVPAKLRGRAYNNGRTTVSAGVTLIGVTDADLDIECYDDQATKTQDYGLWLAGGGGVGVALTGSIRDNLTADIYTTSGGVAPRRVSAKVGASALRASASRSIAKVRRSATAQSIPNVTATVVAWDATDWEDLDIVDTAGATPSRFTIPASLNGLRVCIDASVIYASNTTGIRRVQILKNGTTTLAGRTITAPSAGEADLGVTAYDTAATGDYYEVVCYQSSGVAIDLLANVRNWATLILV